MAENTTRPPTPVGWSDTDWIKHLQERKESHPLAGLHINQGSMDAAADAYEAEYNAAQEARNFRPRRWYMRADGIRRWVSNDQPCATSNESDLWRCTECGRIGSVGRCCGDETREPVRTPNAVYTTTDKPGPVA